MNEILKNKNLTRLKILAVVLITIVIGLFMILPDSNTGKTFSLGAILVVALGVLYAILAKNLKPEKKTRTMYRNKYHDIFFKGTVVFAVLLSVMGVLYSISAYLDGVNSFSIIGLLIAVVWVSVFMIYFVWSVYHYNINYGITDEEWEKIFEAKELKEYGVHLFESEIEEPKHNPYRSQTFGLPPGTVRGMIAFTLLIGGISLLISSFGAQYVSEAEVAMRTQQFEFFETAFLMMIAFYFGDRSLKYFSQRWRTPGGISKVEEEIENFKTGGDKSKKKNKVTFEVEDNMDIEDAIFKQDDQIFGMQNDKEIASGITDLKNTLWDSEIPSAVSDNMGYVQIQDNINSKVLNDDQIMESLENLVEESNIILSLPVIKAVISVESSGRGHLVDGRAKILFEGHKFWYWLEQSGNPDHIPEKLVKGNEDILYRSWTTEHYKFGAAEYERLERARKIDETAAIYACSWGLFQILGENLEHHIRSRKYASVLDFERKQHESEYNHFLDFLAFIQHKQIKGKALIHYISEDTNGNYDWASFAFGYNGSGYAVNQYDQKLKAAFDKFKRA